MAPKNTDCAQSFAEARLCAVHNLPYLRSYLMGLIPVEQPGAGHADHDPSKPGVGTMGVDQYGRVYYDPDFLRSIPIQQSAWVIVHEALHLLLRHHERAFVYAGGDQGIEENHVVLNVAMDLTDNQILAQCKGKLEAPEGVCTPNMFGVPENQSFEQYVDLLYKQVAKIKKMLGLQGDGPPQPGKGSSGSCADGRHRPWEHGQPAEGKTQGWSEQERRTMERIAAKDIAEHESRQRGTVPGDLARLAGDLLRPKFDPRRELFAAIKFALGHTSGFGDYTWKKLPRRHPPGIRMPAHIRPLPRVTCIIDTSGSMGETDLSMALGVLTQCLAAMPIGVRVLTGDTHVHTARQAFRRNQVELVGGGGTDMSHLIVEAAQENPRPQVIVVLTDGETPWPASAVGPRVVACLTRESTHYQVPEWIKTVVLQQPACE